MPPKRIKTKNADKSSAGGQEPPTRPQSSTSHNTIEGELEAATRKVAQDQKRSMAAQQCTEENAVPMPKCKDTPDQAASTETPSAKRAKPALTQGLDSQWLKDNISRGAVKKTKTPAMGTKLKVLSAAPRQPTTEMDVATPSTGSLADENAVATAAIRDAKAMGLKAAIALDIDMAVKKEAEAVKPLQLQGMDDIPFCNLDEYCIFDSPLVTATLDWAGAADDPFSMNEHYQINKILQKIWDELLLDNPLNVSAFESELVLKVFAMHLKHIASSPLDFHAGYLVGALALAAVSVKHAFKKHQQVQATSDDKGITFRLNEWGNLAVGWTAYLRKFDDQKWGKILVAAGKFAMKSHCSAIDFLQAPVDKYEEHTTMAVSDQEDADENKDNRMKLSDGEGDSAIVEGDSELAEGGEYDKEGSREVRTDDELAEGDGHIDEADGDDNRDADSIRLCYEVDDEVLNHSDLGTQQ
ncbi:hypothetical protein K488DRAFT_74595 [Vararia minispora EC-137]|uniref:Uncharacterized protein n=1 Tax=Vararia minispora EC-137 TaxID=1314806 RepID=A0ACB8Q6M3_9AGAM|nr:hypothetical protein K488DRAFT_74595 [Vararia minispora EC-137]